MLVSVLSYLGLATRRVITTEGIVILRRTPQSMNLVAFTRGHCSVAVSLVRVLVIPSVVEESRNLYTWG